LRVAEVHGEIEVVKRRYRPWNEGEVIIILRLKELQG